jgi:hypothetical protein
MFEDGSGVLLFVVSLLVRFWFVYVCVCVCVSISFSVFFDSGVCL